VSEREPIVSRLGNASFRYWFPAFRWAARRVSPDFLAQLSESTVERAVWARRPVREAILDNFSRVLRLPASHDLVEETAHEMLHHHSRLWIDLLRLSGRDDLDPRSLVAGSRGEEQLLDVKRRGGGGILVTAHVGNFELGGMFLKDMGLDVHAVYAPDPSPAVEAHREEARREMGVKGIPVTSSPFAFVPMLRALKEGSFLAMQGDRDYAGNGARVPFLGETASFPTGPFRLAQASGAPLFPVFVLREADGRYRPIVEAPIPVRNARGVAEKDAAVGEALATFVGIFERTIRQHPAQWYLFQRFWE
jgi:KDO2-lipid IV(A) lauroyltransferase